MTSQMTLRNIKKLLRVALIGAPNAGKSTLLNRFVGCNISCVSEKVHTTRNNVLGVLTEKDTQIEFFDTPGVITKRHMLKHRLEDSLLYDPEKASSKCDLIAVIVDASNVRDQRRIDKGVLKALRDNPSKQSILILNKVDLVKDKRLLLDVGTRLSQGCIDGKCTIDSRELKYMTLERIKELNLLAHVKDNFRVNLIVEQEKARPKHRFVIELDQDSDDHEKPKNPLTQDPDSVGYKDFSEVFSISALNDDGVDQLREHLMSKAQPVEMWPHGPDYVSNQTTKNLVHGIIRGKVLDYVSHAVPYLLKYKYLQCSFDDMGSLHVNLTILCPEKYMVSMVIGERGVTIFRIIEDSRDIISETLKCDVKLGIQVEQITTGR